MQRFRDRVAGAKSARGRAGGNEVREITLAAHVSLAKDVFFILRAMGSHGMISAEEEHGVSVLTPTRSGGGTSPQGIEGF